MPIRSFAVCSETKVGKRSVGEGINVHALALPATTDADKLMEQVAAADATSSLTVVFKRTSQFRISLIRRVSAFLNST